MTCDRQAECVMNAVLNGVGIQSPMDNAPHGMRDGTNCLIGRRPVGAAMS